MKPQPLPKRTEQFDEDHDEFITVYTADEIKAACEYLFHRVCEYGRKEEYDSFISSECLAEIIINEAFAPVYEEKEK